jgi:hypothetical protein
MGWHVLKPLSAWCSPSIWSSRLNCRQYLTTTCQVSLHLSICTWAIEVLNTYWELRDPTQKLHQIKIKCTTDFTGISLIFTPGSGLQRPSGENKNHYKEYHKARPVHIQIKSKDITIPENSQTESIHEPKVGTHRKSRDWTRRKMWVWSLCFLNLIPQKIQDVEIDISAMWDMIGPWWEL